MRKEVLALGILMSAGLLTPTASLSQCSSCVGGDDFGYTSGDCSYWGYADPCEAGVEDCSFFVCATDSGSSFSTWGGGGCSCDPY